MAIETLTALGKIEYLVWRNGEPFNRAIEFYHDGFKKAFSRMFPNFKIVEESERRIKAHCEMHGSYFEIDAVDVSI